MCIRDRSEEEQEQYAWGNLWPQALPKYLPEGFEFIEENPNYDEKKAVEETYEPNLTENVIPSFWVEMDKVCLLYTSVAGIGPVDQGEINTGL